MSLASFLKLFFLLTLNRFYVTFWCFYCRLWTYKCRLDYGSLVYKNVRKIIRNTDHKNGWEIFLILTVWKRPGPDVNIAGKLSSFQCTYCCLSPTLICSHRLLIILNMIYLSGYSNSVITRLKNSRDRFNIGDTASTALIVHNVWISEQTRFWVVFKYTLKGIYPSSFTNVHFWTKIEFSKVVKCTWGSWGAASSATSSWRRLGEGSEG